MPAQGTPRSGFPDDGTEQGIRWRIWLLIGLLTLLWHGLVLLSHIHWAPPLQPPRVEVQRIDPKKLDAIRKQWARERNQQLLIDKDKNRPSDKEAPPDARYMSDRNIHVEKEQRARQSTVVPKAGAPGPRAEQQQREASPPKAQAQPKTRIPRLGNLGLPFHLDSKPPKPLAQRDPTQPGQRSQRSGDEGGEQYVKDNTAPEGAENLLNAQESVFYSFYARLYEAIGPIWQSLIRGIGYRRRVQPGEYSTIVDVVFDREGNLVGVNRERSSGIDEFDQAVESAWKQVRRFPNPPTGLLDESGQVHTGWTFTVQVGDGFNLDYLPPERNY